MHDPLPHLIDTDFPAIRRGRLKTLQVNLGYRCNLSCVHCHVAAGPKRTETMGPETIDAVLAALATNRIETLDLTGGAPELNAHFRTLVRRARALGVHVIDRCNLTILLEPDQQDLASFLAEQQVEIIASLPCYLEENVDGQRGKGVYAASIEALQRLNALGYGRGDTGLVLNLIYNPQGPVLPPPQCPLEGDYRARLAADHGIVFDRLYTLTNMPIQRFGSLLISQGALGDYLALLKSAHRDANLETVMCRELISIDWQGHVYDCDFNQMLRLPLRQDGKERVHLRELDLGRLDGLPIRVAGHCYGCTAGQGSSCSGALTD
ncbi:MAG: arsenosugar biosynthesis radical SAM protein ArsS [Thiohalocapsa sp.]|jgi:radical SAM/Cys-rich protein|uniref:arsenosugar biosynthesis radical SAM (seleno)protein ArsS n=1 Tax=Thiohalocapsa sp. TaxID=2497641 RepID=UPI0025CCAB43|nr:arsenosugar biosynthesis radical SAM (seleno)protein ArsS [Thiohalocapsa sp.]MCG6940896.1 arsenosugar biosynthesis radical SAM protein ArsS [Thiohalocapsa sp.]